MIRVPENWPLAWWGSDGAQIKMSCPSCGAFAMLLTRNIPDGSLRSLACEGCGLSGVKPVQDAFDGWVAAHAQARAQDQADHATAMEEGNRGVAVERQQRTRKVA